MSVAGWHEVRECEPCFLHVIPIYAVSSDLFPRHLSSRLLQEPDDYRTYVANPIFLSDVFARLVHGRYSTADEVRDDVLAVFANSIKYFGAESTEGVRSARLSTAFRAAWAAIAKDIQSHAIALATGQTTAPTSIVSTSGLSAPVAGAADGAAGVGGGGGGSKLRFRFGGGGGGAAPPASAAAAAPSAAAAAAAPQPQAVAPATAAAAKGATSILDDIHTAAAAAASNAGAGAGAAGFAANQHAVRGPNGQFIPVSVLREEQAIKDLPMTLPPPGALLEDEAAAHQPAMPSSFSLLGGPADTNNSNINNGGMMGMGLMGQAAAPASSTGLQLPPMGGLDLPPLMPGLALPPFTGALPLPLPLPPLPPPSSSSSASMLTDPAALAFQQTMAGLGGGLGGGGGFGPGLTGLGGGGGMGQPMSGLGGGLMTGLGGLPPAPMALPPLPALSLPPLPAPSGLAAFTQPMPAALPQPIALPAPPPSVAAAAFAAGAGAGPTAAPQQQQQQPAPPPVKRGPGRPPKGAIIQGNVLIKGTKQYDLVEVDEAPAYGKIPTSQEEVYEAMATLVKTATALRVQRKAANTGPKARDKKFRIEFVNLSPFFAKDPSFIATDYTDRIEQPMWIERVTEKFDSGAYAGKPEDLLHDLLLIGTNCKTYNSGVPEWTWRADEWCSAINKQYDKLFRGVVPRRGRPPAGGFPRPTAAAGGTAALPSSSAAAALPAAYQAGGAGAGLVDSRDDEEGEDGGDDDEHDGDDAGSHAEVTADAAAAAMPPPSAGRTDDADRAMDGGASSAAPGPGTAAQQLQPVASSVVDLDHDRDAEDGDIDMGTGDGNNNMAVAEAGIGMIMAGAAAGMDGLYPAASGSAASGEQGPFPTAAGDVVGASSSAHHPGVKFASGAAQAAKRRRLVFTTTQQQQPGAGAGAGNDEVEVVDEAKVAVGTAATVFASFESSAIVKSTKSFLDLEVPVMTISDPQYWTRGMMQTLVTRLSKHEMNKGPHGVPQVLEAIHGGHLNALYVPVMFYVYGTLGKPRPAVFSLDHILKRLKANEEAQNLQLELAQDNSAKNLIRLHPRILEMKANQGLRYKSLHHVIADLFALFDAAADITSKAAWEAARMPSGRVDVEARGVRAEAMRQYVRGLFREFFATTIAEEGKALPAQRHEVRTYVESVPVSGGTRPILVQAIQTLMGSNEVGKKSKLRLLARDFSQPVAHLYPDLTPEYWSIVTKPMDFGSIRERLQADADAEQRKQALLQSQVDELSGGSGASGVDVEEQMALAARVNQYETHGQFAADVELVLDNAIRFNSTPHGDPKIAMNAQALLNEWREVIWPEYCLDLRLTVQREGYEAGQAKRAAEVEAVRQEAARTMMLQEKFLGQTKSTLRDADVWIQRTVDALREGRLEQIPSVFVPAEGALSKVVGEITNKPGSAMPVIASELAREGRAKQQPAPSIAGTASSAEAVAIALEQAASKLASQSAAASSSSSTSTLDGPAALAAALRLPSATDDINRQVATGKSSINDGASGASNSHSGSASSSSPVLAMALSQSRPGSKAAALMHRLGLGNANGKRPATAVEQVR